MGRGDLLRRLRFRDAAGRQRAVAAKDLDAAVDAARQAHGMKRGDAGAQLAELLDLEVKCFYQLSRKRVPAKERAALEKQVHALGEEIVSHAIALAAACRARRDYAGAEAAEKLAERPASLVASARLVQRKLSRKEAIGSGRQRLGDRDAHLAVCLPVRSRFSSKSIAGKALCAAGATSMGAAARSSHI